MRLQCITKAIEVLLSSVVNSYGLYDKNQYKIICVINHLCFCSSYMPLTTFLFSTIKSMKTFFFFVV